MPKMRGVLYIDQPREKGMRFGVESLSDVELLTILIGVGSVGENALELSQEIISDNKSIYSLINKPYQFFTQYRGISSVKAIKLAACFEIAKRYEKRIKLLQEESETISSQTLFERYVGKLSGLEREQFILVVLNKNKRIVFEKTLYKGSESSIALNINEIIKSVLLSNGTYFYIIHNHPNESLRPSINDETFTMRLKNKARKNGLILLDHIIICENNYYSMLNNSENSFTH